MPSSVAFMVVAIVAIVTLGRIYRAKHGIADYRGSRIYAEQAHLPQPQDDREAKALREEVKMLRDRVAVLERIATDNHDAMRIDEEIARLRDR